MFIDLGSDENLCIEEAIKSSTNHLTADLPMEAFIPGTSTGRETINYDKTDSENETWEINGGNFNEN